jgi:hypothetical protein
MEMSALAAFLQDILYEGRARLRDRPERSTQRDPEALAVLRQAFADHRLDVAGPLLELDEAVALGAAEFIRQAAWFLVSRDEPPEELDQPLGLPGPPRSATQHLSADLVLRLLPAIHRRARALDPTDRLTIRLAEVLRRWPLSGVLADVEEGPLTPLDFDDHPGLLLLYAERLAQHPKPAWMPEGLGREYVELVWRELGCGPDTLPPPRLAAGTAG